MPSFGYRPEKQHPRVMRFLQNRTRVVLSAAFLVAMSYFMLSPKGFVSRITIARDIGDKEARVIELRRRIGLLEHERNRLRDDQAAIEHVAREVHGMIRPGEEVYRVLPAGEAAESEK
jgi:cell division protein FtsB